MSSTAAADPPRDEAPGPKSQFANESLFLLGTIIVVGIFASTMPQPQVLGRIPLQNLLKNQLHASRSVNASFFFWCGIFWYLKPFAGILTDAFPLFRTRRRHYMLISSVLAAASWILLGFLPPTYSSLLYGCIFLSLFMVMMSTVTGAILVEVGNSRGATGHLTAVRQITSNICQLLNGTIGGWLAGGAFMLCAGVNAALVLTLFPVAYALVKERPEAVKSMQAFENAGAQLVKMFSSWPFWAAIVFIGLYYFAPGIGTMTFYRQQDVLHLNTQHQGYLGSISGAGQVLAAVIYALLAKRISLRASLFFGIATAALSTMAYLYYNSWSLAMPIDFQNGFFGGFAEVALIVLAARATPKGCEGLGYSCILSMRNISLFGADKLGSTLADNYHWSWASMVWLNGVTTAVVLILLPFMPKILMRSKDTGG